MTYPEYAGLSYRASSQKAADLLRRASTTGNWIKDLPERLAALRENMARAEHPVYGDIK